LDSRGHVVVIEIIKMITSSHNSKIANIRALMVQARARHAQKAFVVEGVRLAEEALTAGWEAKLVLYTPDLSERGQQVVQGFVARDAQVEQVTSSVLQAVSDTHSPQGVLVVLSMNNLPLPEVLDFIFIPDGVRDPGNLGTMLRTAAAAGVSAIFLPPGIVDIHSPQVVRSAMGAHFKIPIRDFSWDEIQQCLNNNHIKVYLADVQRGECYTDVDFRMPLALILGGEAQGAGEQAQRLADGYVTIPMPGGVESLNAGVAAGILLFEVVRQRQPFLRGK
jgi:RNA methyltransferase, TrmH family